MLGKLQDRRGAPKLRVRILAALVVFGLLYVTAWVVVVPIVDWIAGQL